MIGNKYHILVAPNGFGKSSISCAFDNLKPQSLKVPESMTHQQDVKNIPFIEIVYNQGKDDMLLRADQDKNEIKKVFSVSVINSRVKPKATSNSGYNPHAKPKASMVIEPVVLVERIPERSAFSVKNSQFEEFLGSNVKVLPSFKVLLDNVSLLGKMIEIADRFNLKKRSLLKTIDIISNDIKNNTAKTDDLLTWIQDQKLSVLREIPELTELVAVVSILSDYTETQKYLLVYQFVKIYHNCPAISRTMAIG